MCHIHCDGVLVIAVADIPAVVLAIRPSVHNALGIVDVAILTGSTQGHGVGRVL